MSLDLEGKGNPKVLNFKRKKICKERNLPAEGLVSDPAGGGGGGSAAEAEDGSGVANKNPPAHGHRSSILLASVSPTVFIGKFSSGAQLLSH